MSTASLKKLIVFTLVLTVLTAWVEWQHQHRREVTKLSGQVMPLSLELIESIELYDRGDKLSLKLVKQNAAWTLPNYPDYYVSASEVKRWLSLLVSAPKIRTLRADEVPALGEQEGRVLVEMKTSSGVKSHGLTVLGQTALNNNYYAKTDAGDVMVVGGSFTEILMQNADDLRARRLFSIEPWDVSTVTVKRKRNEVALARLPEGWRLSVPLVDYPDVKRLTDLVKRSSELSAKEFVAKNDPLYPLLNGILTEKKAEFVLSLGSDKDSKGTQAQRRERAFITFDRNTFKMYAKREGYDNIMLIDEMIINDLDTPVNLFRSPFVFVVQPSAVDKVEISKGSDSLSFSKVGKEWFSGKDKLDVSLVQQLLNQLLSLRIRTYEMFAADELKPPVDAQRITVWTGERKQTVSFWASANAGMYVKRDDTDYIYRIDPKDMPRVQVSQGMPTKQAPAQPTAK